MKRKTSAGFKPVSAQVNFPELDEKIITYWKDNTIFEKSIAKKAPRGEWTFLDGPPFITGLPHYGSLLSSIPKDLFPRFKTMQGYRVRRVWGWDCHGLPAENKVETELGLKSKREIEATVGVKKFIEECKSYVSQVSSEWEWYVDHVGRWVDFKNAYKTMDVSYMESVMWVFKQMYEKGYIYKGLRVSLYCPHCATPISNFEVAMDADNYKDVTDPGTVYKYKLRGEENTFVLAWSTTPWNKIVTPALAVNPELEYVKIKQGNEYYILAKKTVGSILSKRQKSEAVESFRGKELIGKKFEPHYDYYPIEKGKKAFEIIPGEFVTAQEGTGVVTIAAYGEEDLLAMQEHNVHIEMHLDEEGIVKPGVPIFGGNYYLKANKLVNEDLHKRGLIYEDKDYVHKVPLCWRCHTRLYYAPQDAWFVDIQALKPKLKTNNESVNWFPKHFKYGRFAKSMDAAPDWCISRSRYFGSPVPVWECVCGERFVPGSIKELEERSGRNITDLHKPEIDEITVPCLKCKGMALRVPEVLDSWIEAGSASFAERHFPFDPSAGSPRSGSGQAGQEAKLEDFFPPDFIVEYTGQIRAWFYVLHVIATALFNTNAFKNVVVTGVILGTDGRKMSKNYGNYPDPRQMLQKYGGDALRLYLMRSPVMHGEDILISEEKYREQVRGILLIVWNVYNFFVSYAIVDSWGPDQAQEASLRSKNVLDRWILSLTSRLIADVTFSLEQYDTVSAVNRISRFVDDLSTWYIRRSRDRIGPVARNKDDKDNFYTTCHFVLVALCKLLAPITPFFAEEVFRNVTSKESVHLENWPVPDPEYTNETLEKEMSLARNVVMAAHAKRKLNGIKLRQPLRALTYRLPKQLGREIEDIIGQETNVEGVRFEETNSKSEEPLISMDTALDDYLKAKGQARDIVRAIQEERKIVGTNMDEKIDVVLDFWPEEFETFIKTEALVDSLTKGERLRVIRKNA